MQGTVSDEPHSTDNHTGDGVGLFTTTTTTTTLTTTVPSSQNSDFNETTVHLVVIVCSLIVFVGLLCSIKSIVNFVRSLQRRQQGSNISGDTRPGSSFFRWFSDDPPPYPGKYSRTNVNYLPSYESAIKITNELNQTTLSDVTSAVADTEPESGLPEVNSDSGAIMFTAPDDMNTAPDDMNNSSEPTRSSEFENSNENRVDAHSDALNLGNETCSASSMNESLQSGQNVHCDINSSRDSA